MKYYFILHNYFLLLQFKNCYIIFENRPKPYIFHTLPFDVGLTLNLSISVNTLQHTSRTMREYTAHDTDKPIMIQ